MRIEPPNILIVIGSLRNIIPKIEPKTDSRDMISEAFEGCVYFWQTT